MLSRGLYEALRALYGNIYSDGRPIPPWDRPVSPAVERDERVWGEFATAATFAVVTRQQLGALEPGTGAPVGGAFVVRAAGEMSSPYLVYKDESRAVVLARLVSLDIATELLLRRHVTIATGAPLDEDQ
jgi:hypothetical protein